MKLRLNLSFWIDVPMYVLCSHATVCFRAGSGLQIETQVS
jgi:hypothetical protein